MTTQTAAALPLRLARSLVTALAANRARAWWMLWLFLAALAVRVHWNVAVHPLGEYLYSDMHGYASRADQILDEPFRTYEYAAFFPFGTAWIVAAAKWTFGRENWAAIGTVFAVMGALIVPMCYSIVDRTMGERVRWVAPACGLAMVFYYPLIGIGSYVLSELPFAFFLTAALYFLIRLLDEGKRRDAWLLGVMLGCGALVRSQMMASLGLFGLGPHERLGGRRWRDRGHRRRVTARRHASEQRHRGEPTVHHPSDYSVRAVDA